MNLPAPKGRRVAGLREFVGRSSMPDFLDPILQYTPCGEGIALLQVAGF